MTASQIRAEARKKLASKWGKSALITFLFCVLTYVFAFVLELLPMIGSLVWTVISAPLSYGFLISMFKLNDDNEIGYIDFLNNGFLHFGKVWSVVLYTALKLILPIILVVISAFIFAYGSISENLSLILIGIILYCISLIYAIIKQYTYKFALFVLYDNPDIGGKEAVEKSAELMQGKVWSLFCLDLSFIGWSLLSIFTFGIGLFWLLPYLQIAEINFYRNLTGNETEVVVNDE